MYPLSNLAPRPTFNRQSSDNTLSERAQAALRAPSPAFSDVSADVLLPSVEAQSGAPQDLRTRLAQQGQKAARQALPFWREGLVFALFVGVTTWLAVLTQKVRDLELIPFCDEIARR